MRDGSRVSSAYILGSLAFVTLFLAPWAGKPQRVKHPPGSAGLAVVLSPPLPTQMPGTDRLAEPSLPESPTQVDLGRRLYYFHCMPCHGDKGQGLTDEWREVWVDDHQNCWARACHTGKSEVEAFYIPKFVPPVSGSAQALASFQTADELFVFLRETQPPQRPGDLSDVEYWELTAFLLHENDRLATGEWLGPGSTGPAVQDGDVLWVLATTMLALFLVLWLGKRQRVAKSAQVTQRQT